MKTCFKCGAMLPISAFYRHKAMADGRLGKCKECTKLDVRQHRQAHASKVRAYDRSRAVLPKRKAMKLALNRRYRNRHPERALANHIAATAIKDGSLVRQPCEACGERKVVAHHDDYGNPLAVRWLCYSCHRRHHAGTL